MAVGDFRHEVGAAPTPAIAAIEFRNQLLQEAGFFKFLFLGEIEKRGAPARKSKHTPPAQFPAHHVPPPDADTDK